ncbi:MAG: YcgL domain-containing protein [Halioglobus sp.]
MICQVFRSSRQQEMYLYVQQARGTQDVPEALLRKFGELVPVMVLQLTPERKLARADAATVLTSLEQQGYYLQLPPLVADLLSREVTNG